MKSGTNPEQVVARIPATGLTQRQIRLEVPEHVRLDYDLADLGSRFAAFLVDAALVGASVVLVVLASSLFAGGENLLAGIGRAVAIVVVFLLIWGYFAGFEALDGRTPGKRLLGLRVLHSEGRPVTAKGAIIRNLVRLVDLQPAATGALGGAVMMLSARTQRLGDLAADTIVIRDDDWGLPPWERAPEAERPGRPRLDEKQFALLSSYVRRRDGLSPAVRRRLAATVAGAMRATTSPLDAPPELDGAEDHLERLYHEERGRRGGEPEGWKRQAAALARRRSDDWRMYGRLVARAKKHGLAKLAEDEVRAFGRLYRGMAADLARARAYGAPASLLYALEKWTGTGHNLLYSADNRSGRSLWRWIGVVLPRAVRAQAGGVGLAALILFGAGLGTYAAVRADPGLARFVVPAAMFARAENTPQGEAGASYIDVPAAGMPVLASGVIVNNLQVSFLVFAGGMLAGVGTGLVLAMNGVLLGAVFGLYANQGVFGALLAFVAPHGVLELVAVCIAGGAGFGLARAVLLPGRHTRRRALAAQARRSVSTLGCAALLLLLAGLVEGFYSPSGLAPESKFLFAGASAIGLALYFGMAGRGGEDAPVSTRGPAP